MQKKKLTFRNGLAFSLVLFTCMLIMTAQMISCNNESKEKKENTQDTAGVAVAGPAVLANTLDKFPVLYSAWTDIVNTFADPAPGQQIRKIVFKFHFDGGAINGQPTLIGYTARQNGQYIPNTHVITLMKSAATPIELAYDLNLGNIEFTRAEFDALRNGQPPPQQFLVFMPVKSIPYPNSVTYKTAWSSIVPTAESIKILALGDELNPSPPRDPAN